MGAPMGLYMHAAWFFGVENNYHYNGYMDFVNEITATYDDVWFVTISEGLDYVKNYNSLSNADLLALTNTDAPFGCPPVTGVDCSALRPCLFPHVENDDIPGQERYMTICGRTSDNSRQNFQTRSVTLGWMTPVAETCPVPKKSYYGRIRDGGGIAGMLRPSLTLPQISDILL